MELKKKYRYSLVIPTSMGIRMTPAGRQPINTSYNFTMQSTSAESNVGNISSSLGLRVKLLTAFVKDNEIALFIKNELRKRNIEFEGPDVQAGGPWGYRHQINIADSGYGLRGPRVINDRAGEVGRILNADDFDLHRIFVKEGVAILHMSGLIAALSTETSLFCLALAKVAKQTGTLVCFDLNYRASFWHNRETELRDAFMQIAGLADILIGNEEDFQLALGIKGPETKGFCLENKIDDFKGMLIKARVALPDVAIYAITLRQVINANTHLWGSILLYDDNWYILKPREIPVFDRIGGGDGFVGGLLYAILQGWEPEKWSQFGWATGAMAASLSTDYASPVSESQVWSIYEGDACVRR